MADYSVLWVAGKDDRRDYYDRQQYANQEKCVFYVEHHLNAKVYDKPGTQDNPSLCLVGSNASAKSKSVGEDYSKRISEAFGFRNGGCIKLAFRGRGDSAMRYTHMPAILVEPLFVSDHEQALIAQSDIGQETMARILVETIRENFPNGGKIGFSVGHKFKVSSPYDRGAPVVGTDGLGEADLTEQIMNIAAGMLESGGTEEPIPQERRIEFSGEARIEASGDKIIIILPRRET